MRKNAPAIIVFYLTRKSEGISNKKRAKNQALFLVIFLILLSPTILKGKFLFIVLHIVFNQFTPVYNFFNKKMPHKAFCCIMNLIKTLQRIVTLYDKLIIQ